MIQDLMNQLAETTLQSTQDAANVLADTTGLSIQDCMQEKYGGSGSIQDILNTYIDDGNIYSVNDALEVILNE